MIRKFTLLLFVLATNSYGFEIKPVCPFNDGAYCANANVKDIQFRTHSDECLNEKSYVLKSNNQPVHEAITRKAYRTAFGKDLNGYNYEQPLIGGVEWNDDPEVLSRKMWYGPGIKGVKKFIGNIDKNANDKSTMTYRSHYGDMQFLHSMMPENDRNLSDSEVKQLIYDWIKNTYAIATGEIKYDQDIKGTYFEKYFPIGDKYQNISHIFDPNHLYQGDARLPRQTQLFASGSILHLIQDSYSRSHTHREFGVWKIKEFYKYPNHNHCLSDAGAITNKTEIEKAISMSTRYLKIKDSKGNDWCTHMAPFIKEVFDMSDTIDEQCK